MTLRNADEQNDYMSFKVEIREMLNDVLAKDILDDLPTNLLKPRQKLMVFLMRLHLLKRGLPQLQQRR